MVVSFVIPFYNSEHYIKDTIESVVNSGYPDFEICLIDDGGKDASADICRSYQLNFPETVHVYEHANHENRGVSASRELGVKMAKGDLIYFLDSDDLLMPGTIEKYIQIFEGSPEIILIHGRIELIGLAVAAIDIELAFDLGPSGRKYHLSEESYFLQENHICNSTVCFRKSSIIGLDFSYLQAFQVEDWALWTLLSERGMFYYSPEIVCKYRYHTASATHEVNTKGHLFYVYTRVELYMVLAAKMTSKRTRAKVAKLLYDNLNILYNTYSKGSRKRIAFRLPIILYTRDYVKSLINRQ